MGTPARKIAFVSPHCVMDFTNGAATATLDGLALLARAGFKCEAFCNTHVDAWAEVLIEEVLAQRGARYTVRNARIGQFLGRMIFTSHGTGQAQVPVTLFNSASTRGGWQSPREIGAFLTGCELFLKKNRPDVVWTYGGDAVSVLLHKIVRGLDIPLLFSLHNFAYLDGSIFHPSDRVVVPTEFARRFYRETIGLECAVLPLVMDAERVKAGSGEEGAGRIEQKSPRPSTPPAREGKALDTRALAADAPRPGTSPAQGSWAPALCSPLPAPGSFVTFINPEPRKGVHVFARIAEVLAGRRPDIRLLLVEGAARRSSLAALGVDLSGIENLTIWPNTPDPRKFYAVSRMILMPSLMENAGFVAMEAMTNGIPVLASNRGGLPETIGGAAPTIDIPERYTPFTRDIPTEEEVEPWVCAIVRLWDDAAERERWSQAALARSRCWSAEALQGTYAEFFAKIAGQSGARASQPPIHSLQATTSGPKSLAPALSQSARGNFVTCKWLGQSGRLGNHMFQIAATIGAARRNGVEYVFPPWSFARHFERPIPQSAAIALAEVYAEPSFAYRDIRVCRPTDLAGCWQSERYFKHCEAEVRGYFAPRAELLARLEERFGKLLARPTCSVHVRRGDYTHLPEYADLAASDYYERAIARFPGDTTFLFFSDDVPWCQKRFRDRRFAFIVGQSDIEDLFLMSLCGGHIIANSSFSWWAAWLDARPQKTVIAPARWFAGKYADPSLPFSSQPYQGFHDTSDIIPTEWIKL